MIPRLNVLNYPWSYSALLNLHSLKTDCESRRQPNLNHENQSCTRDKDQFIWLQDMLVPKHQFITLPQYLLFVWSDCFNCFSWDKQEIQMLHISSLQPWRFYPLHSFSWLPAVSPLVFILPTFAPPALTNLSSYIESHALVKAALLEFNTFLWHGRLGSHDHTVPWLLTSGA